MLLFLWMNLVTDGTFNAIGVSTSGCVGKESLSHLIEGLVAQAPNAVLAIGGSITTCNPQLVDELRDGALDMRDEKLTTLLQNRRTKGTKPPQNGSQAVAASHSTA